MPPEPGRNDPCPCGSGRKYKHCCLKASEATDFLWRQVRFAEGRLIPELFELAIAERGAGFLEAALDEFFAGHGVPTKYEESEQFGTFFVPWCVLEFVANRHDRQGVAGAPAEPVAAAYLRQHRDRLTPVERAFLEAGVTSPMSFYAVTRTIPGREIALHDILTGADIVVRERTASQSVTAGGVLFTRVVTVDGMSIMVGCSPILIPPAWHNPIIDVRGRLAAKGRTLTERQLHERAFELRQLYLQIEDALYNPRLPKVRNTDGEPIVLTRLRFTLRCTPASAFDRLKPLAREPDASVLMAGAVLDEAGALQSISLPWIKTGNRLHRNWKNTALGRIEITADRLEVEVNSRPRATRIRREIEKRLGPDAILADIAADPLDVALEKHRGRPIDLAAEAAEEQFQQQPEVQEFMRRAAARHWEAWLGEKIPALGNRTPKQAARTQEGRERLEALLADYAWGTERSANAFSPDVRALRRTLGLPDVSGGS